MELNIRTQMRLSVKVSLSNDLRVPKESHLRVLTPENPFALLFSAWDLTTVCLTLGRPRTCQSVENGAERQIP